MIKTAPESRLLLITDRDNTLCSNYFFTRLHTLRENKGGHYLSSTKSATLLWWNQGRVSQERHQKWHHWEGACSPSHLRESLSITLSLCVWDFSLIKYAHIARFTGLLGIWAANKVLNKWHVMSSFSKTLISLLQKWEASVLSTQWQCPTLTLAVVWEASVLPTQWQCPSLTLAVVWEVCYSYAMTASYTDSGCCAQPSPQRLLRKYGKHSAWKTFMCSKIMLIYSYKETC